jgi:hypothetical protein
VHDDLLTLERRIQVRDDANRPRRRPADAEDLRRRAVLAALAERALVELGPGLSLDQPELRAGTTAPVRRNDDESPGERVSPKIQRAR